jgi:hypothetical protein
MEAHCDVASAGLIVLKRSHAGRRVLLAGGIGLKGIAAERRVVTARGVIFIRILDLFSQFSGFPLPSIKIFPRKDARA